MFDDRSFSEKIRDKTFRTKIMMIFYLILFIVLIVFIRLSPNKKTELKNEKKDKETKKVEHISNDGFKLILSKNYNFNYILKYNDNIIDFTGKRFNNKYDFTMKRNGEISHFLGTEGLIRVNKENTVNVLPYYFINYFDIDLLKSIINLSKEDNGIYNISNEKLNNLLKNNQNMTNLNGNNSIKLVKKNGYIIEINIIYTEYAKEFDKDVRLVEVNLKHNNFYLVDEFAI